MPNIVSTDLQFMVGLEDKVKSMYAEDKHPDQETIFALLNEAMLVSQRILMKKIIEKSAYIDDTSEDVTFKVSIKQLIDLGDYKAVIDAVLKLIYDEVHSGDTTPAN